MPVTTASLNILFLHMFRMLYFLCQNVPGNQLCCGFLSEFNATPGEYRVELAAAVQQASSPALMGILRFVLHGSSVMLYPVSWPLRSIAAIDLSNILLCHPDCI